MKVCCLVYESLCSHLVWMYAGGAVKLCAFSCRYATRSQGSGRRGQVIVFWQERGARYVFSDRMEGPRLCVLSVHSVF